MATLQVNTGIPNATDVFSLDEDAESTRGRGWGQGGGTGTAMDGTIPQHNSSEDGDRPAQGVHQGPDTGPRGNPNDTHSPAISHIDNRAASPDPGVLLVQRRLERQIEELQRAYV